MMKMVDGQLVPLSPEEEERCSTEWAAADAQRAACEAEKARLAEYDTAIAGDTTLAQLKAMTNAEFGAWWDANITTAAAAIAVLKRLARVIVRRVL
jgi:hypothetical protein